MGDSNNPSDLSSAGAPSAGERLESWKEIAAYLGRTERTARRWEKAEALPVFRHAHAKRDSVYAYKADLDAWRRSRRTRRDEGCASADLDAKDNPKWRRAWAVAFAGAIAVGALALWLHGRPDTRLAEPFKIVPLTSYPGYERYSSFSPDGSQVAFAWKEESRGPFHIYTKTIGSGVPVRRTNHVADDLSPAWSPDGRLIAFLRSFPAERAELVLIPASGGAERPLTSIVRPDSAPSSLILFGHDVAWSPDSRFVIVPGSDSPGQPFGLSLISIETGAKRRILSPAPGSGLYLAPSVSPDGRRLAFVRRTDFAASEIWVSTLLADLTPQGEPARMTFENRLTTSPVWADAHEIMFLSGELGAEASLYRMPVSEPGRPYVMSSLGEGAALLSLQDSGTAFVPRHRRLAYTRVIKDHNVWRTEWNETSAVFGPPRPFVPSTRIDFNPQFSPDGRRIAFESTRSGSMEIWLANHDGSNPTQLTNFGGPLTGAARWSPDGQQLVFNSRLGGQADLYVIGANGGQARRLTYESSNEDLPSWSRDGLWVYFHSDRNGSSQVWKMPIGGGEPIQVTYNGGLAALESINGKYVYYSKGHALGPASLWRVPNGVAHGDETQVVESLADWSTFQVVADGIYFIPHAQAQPKSSIEFLAFTDGRRRKIVVIEKAVSVGLAISNNGLIILYTQVDHDDNDVMLAETPR
jgi:Tol biopolymer transport system component